VNKLDEIKALIERSDEHLIWLQHHIPHINEDVVSYIDPDVITVESSFDIYVTRIRVIIGEFANNLRSALDYLACCMVKQDCGEVTNRVQFPIETLPDVFKDRSRVLLKGLREEHLALFEGFQPYKAGNWIALLRDFTNFHKHQGLIIAKKHVHQIAKFTPTPQAKSRIDSVFGPYPDNMKMQRDLMFTISLPDGSNIVPQLQEIARRIRQVVDQFEPFLKFD
jgi:hypothetical protein